MKRPAEPSPYDDPFYSFNLVGYGPNAPINIVRAPLRVAEGGPATSEHSPPAPSAPAESTRAESVPSVPSVVSCELSAGGRPTKIDPAKQEAFCCLIRAGCSRTVAARLLGVNRRTLWYAAHNDPEFKERVLSAERQCEALAYSNIARAGSQSWRQCLASRTPPTPPPTCPSPQRPRGAAKPRVTNGAQKPRQTTPPRVKHRAKSSETKDP